MSVDENLATTKSAYAAFSAGDIDGASAPLADDIEWVVPGNSAVSGVYHGKDEVLGFWGQLAAKGFTTEPQYYFADGDKVVVLASTKADGQQSDSADVLTFRDGKLVKFQSATDTALQEKIWGSK